MSTINHGLQIVKNGLVLNLDAGNKKSFSTNRFQSYGSGSVTENIGFAINGTGTFQRVAFGTVIGGYTVKPTDVVYSYALGVNGCHYHGSSVAIPAGVYATFSFDYLVTGATGYPGTDFLASFENGLSGYTGVANNLQNVWQRRSFTSGPTGSATTLNMYLYPGGCTGAASRLADSGTIYYRNPKVEFTNTDTGNSTFSSSTSVSTWYDISGNGNNCTLVNGPTSSYINKGAVYFDGVDDYGSITNASSLRPINELTIELVIKAVTTTAGWNHIFGINPYSSYSPLVFLETGGQLIRALHFVDGVEYRCNTVESISTSVFKHVIFTFKPGDAIRSYFNGVASTTTSLPNGTLSYSTSNNFVIGYSGANWPNIQYGLIRMYNRALTTAEISQNYEATRTRFGI